MATLAEQKKLILPYLQRADEIQSLNPKVAYYCRLHAIEQGLQIPNRTPEIQGVLEALMEKLEQDKPAIQLTDEDAQVCEAFAVTVFNRADKQDRAGRADSNTVKGYYVATIFIDVLRHFGELPADMAERQRYAAWKAADIRKAIREGRKPDPGPPVKEDDLGLDLPDIPGSTPASEAPRDTFSQSGDLDLPSIPSQSAPAAPGPSSSQPVIPRPAEIGPPRFRPGSKVFFNAPAGVPEKGTVVNVSRTPTGWVCRVGLRQQVREVAEHELGHDFAEGDPVLFQPPGGPQMLASISKVDASSWPIAYLLALPGGERLPTTEASLAAANSEASNTAASQPGSPSRATTLSSKPSIPPPSSAASSHAEETDDEEAQPASPPAPTNPGTGSHLGGPQPPQPPPGGTYPQPPPGSAAFRGGPPFPQAGMPGGAPASDQQLPPPTQPAYPTPPASIGSPARQPTAPAVAHVPASGAGRPGFQPSMQQITEAHKLTKYALSSLSFEDVPTATLNLRKALELLTGAGSPARF